MSNPSIPANALALAQQNQQAAHVDLDEDGMPPIEFAMKHEGKRSWYEFSPATKEMIAEAIMISSPLRRRLFMKKVRRGQLTQENIKRFIMEATK